MFHSFPDGLSGIALLLMRAASGVTVLREGLSYFSQDQATPWSIAGLLLASGVLLVVGLFTPFAGTAALVIEAAAISGLLQASTSGPGATISFFLLETMLIALLLQGPGAFSVDARIFGRREIIIPLRGE